MKKIITLLFLAVLLSPIYSQETNELKQAKKQEQKHKEKENFQKTKKLLESKAFVLETNYLQDKRGNRIMVNSTINFIKVNSETGVIQIGSDYRIGPNGVGGVTAKGQITKWELNQNKKKKYFNLTMHVMTSIGSYDIHMSIGSDGNARARLSGMKPITLIFDGEIVPLSQTGTYEGSSI